MMRTVSGAHPFRPQCAASAASASSAEAAEEITRNVDRGRCPRCLGPLPRSPIVPAGSRVTDCRCVPVCETCGAHEARARLTPPDRWPLAGVAEELAALPGAAYLATITPAEAARIIDSAPDTGGSLAHGVDDGPDEAERRG